MGRLVAGFLLAPLVAYPVTTLCFWLFLSKSGESWLPLGRGFEGLRYFGLAATLVAYGFMILVGIPVTLFLRKAGQFRLAVMAAAGAYVGIAPYLFGFLLKLPGIWSGYAQDMAAVLPHLLAGGLTGATAALIVWRFGRPSIDKLGTR